MIPIRDENPTRTFPFVTISLIAVNSAVFLYELSLGSGFDAFIRSFGATPCLILTKGGPYVYITLLTSIFLHGSWFHLLGNMLYLWIFGNNVEDVLGHLGFILFYLLSGLGGASAHVIMNPASSLPSLGASGAIAGVLAAYLILFPLAGVDVAIPIFFFISIVRLPALIVIGFWFVLQLLNGYFSAMSPMMEAGGVAWFAHIGGFLIGLLLALFAYKTIPQKD
ncbi:MAG: rhomboid family intramembrane serine protease [Actinomycetota bacterium]|nr:rhomboid family intramembrane serine protease [Actinomycetota bacterium]